jgi:hypothetical protein
VSVIRYTRFVIGRAVPDTRDTHVRLVVLVYYQARATSNDRHRPNAATTVDYRVGLGMTLYFTNKGEVKVTMIDYLKGVINDFPEIIPGTAITPATTNLFEVRPHNEQKVLGEEQARAFHHSVAQLLFATTRARKDIQHMVAFLTMRVNSPDKDDWMTLKRLLKYSRGTIYMQLILKADSFNIVNWWVHASYATHGDCKGRTGATMSMGTGSITGISKK